MARDGFRRVEISPIYRLWCLGTISAASIAIGGAGHLGEANLYKLAYGRLSAMVMCRCKVKHLMGWQ